MDDLVKASYLIDCHEFNYTYAEVYLLSKATLYMINEFFIARGDIRFFNY